MALRDAFPVLDRFAYLNAGTFGPVPRASAEAQRDLLAQAADEGRYVSWFDRTAAAGEAQRAGYARALGTTPEACALTTSTSEGMVRVLAGLDWRPGDEVVTADDEHPGLLGPLLTLRDRRDVEVRAVPLADVPDAVGPRTRLVACSHVSWITGAEVPSLRGVPCPVLLDGAQGLGAVPVDLDALGCDMYAAAGQKWLCGPGGTGVLWLRPGTELEPLGLTYANLAEPNRGMEAEPWPDARVHDQPAFDALLPSGAVAALEVLEADPGRIERGVALAARLAERLEEAGRTVAPRSATTLVSFEDPEPEATAGRLLEAGVVVRWLPGTPYVRASVGGWNDEDDLDRLLAAIRGR